MEVELRKKQLLIIAMLLLLMLGCALRLVESSATTAPIATGLVPVGPTSMVDDFPQRDYWPTKSWRTSTPEKQGMDSTILKQVIDAVEENDYPIDAVIIVRNGYIVLEEYPRLAGLLDP